MNPFVSLPSRRAGSLARKPPGLFSRFLALVVAASIASAPCAKAVTLTLDIQALNQARELFKQATDQLKVVTGTLNEVKSVVRQGQELLRILGNPAALLNELGLGEVVGLLRSVQELNDMGRKTFQQVVGLADEVKSLTDPKHNYFSNYRNLSTIVNGMSRDTGRYKPFAIIETQFTQFNEVVEKDRKIQTDTAKQIADLTKKLQGAKTEYERANIAAALETVRAAQAHSSHQVNAASSQMQGASAAFSAAREKDKELRTEDEELLVSKAAVEAEGRDSRMFGRIGIKVK